MNSGFKEFFQDEEGHNSMTRLLCFLSFWPASWVVVMHPDEASLGWYLGAYVLGYAGGKAVDVASLKVRRGGGKQQEIDNGGH